VIVHVNRAILTLLIWTTFLRKVRGTYLDGYSSDLIHCHEHRLETFMNTKRIAAAFAGATLVVLGGASGAFASYETPSANLTVTPTTLAGGESFSFSATSNQTCDWEITYAGPSSTPQPITGNGTSISGEFSTDVVDSQTTDAVTAVCNFDNGLRASVATSLTRSVDVTLTGSTAVSPPLTGSGSGLPNTGGPSLWLAALGAGLTAIGAGAVIRSRRPARA
jgi:LPXTG-motif cell wall-anchored protein